MLPVYAACLRRTGSMSELLSRNFLKNIIRLATDELEDVVMLLIDEAVYSASKPWRGVGSKGPQTQRHFYELEFRAPR